MANRIELRHLRIVSVAAALLPVLAASAQGTEDIEKKFEDFDASSFSNPTTIDNEWWPLKPGTQYIYEGFTVEAGEAFRR